MSRSRLRPLSLLILVGLLLCPLPARAETLRIVTPELTICGYVEDGSPTGFCFDLTNELAREAGLESVNTLEPLVRVLDGIRSGEVDMSVLAQDELIAGQTVQIGEIQSIRIMAWAKAQTPLRDLRDLEGKPVAIVRGGKFEARAREYRMIPILTRSYELSLKLLMVGRVDAAVGPVEVLAEAARKLNLDRRVLGEPLNVGGAELRVVVSKVLDKSVADRLRAAWVRLRDNGGLESLMKKYKL